jgi:hypothetical protein
MSSVSGETQDFAKVQLEGQTTIEESSKDNVTVKRVYLETLEGMVKYVPQLNPTKAKLIEAEKQVATQREEMTRLSNSLVELARRNEELEASGNDNNTNKELSIILDTTKLSMWSMEKDMKFRNIQLTYNLEEKKITGYEYLH